MLIFLNAYRNNPQAHGIIIVALHLEVFRVSYFPQGMVVNLLSISSKDNTRLELAEVELDSYSFRVFGKINFTSTRLLWAPVYTWSARYLRSIANIELRRGRIRGMDRAITTYCLPLSHGECGKRR